MRTLLLTNYEAIPTIYAQMPRRGMFGAEKLTNSEAFSRKVVLDAAPSTT
ncbi:hypothetical protein Pjdr2_1976 [Paenibacillus sp. JDR-2]|nr:hypothetical protein Pjdr2_1976 [Paenibacillus sp. JDR-2]